MSDDIIEDNFAEDEVLERLLELKELYRAQNGELSGENSSSEESFDAKTSPRPKHQKLSALQSVILQTMEEHGGSCHAETIIEYVRLKWPELRKRDAALYHTTDCRKLVYTNLRQLDIFNQNEQEGYWCINGRLDDDDDDSNRSEDEAEGLLLLDLMELRPTPMTDLITQAIQEKGGRCELDDIYNFVLQKWERPHLRYSDIRHDLTDDEIKESIQVVLRTDPKYVRDSNLFSVVQNPGKRKTKGKSSPASVVPRVPSPTASSASCVPSQDGRPRSNSGKKPRITPPTTPPPAIPPTPPAGYKCLCGAAEPGGKGKWHTSQGQWLCNACGSQWSKKNSCPMCGKVYRNADAKYAIHNSWICCDDCQRWVMTKCDGIEDLSIYDDENPDHLHYSCPLCRSIRSRRVEEEKEQLEKEKIEKEVETVKKEVESGNESPTAQTKPIQPVPLIVPKQAIHPIHAIVQKSPTSTPLSQSPPHAHVPQSPNNRSPTNYIPVPPNIPLPKMEVGKMLGPTPFLSFSAELAIAAANRKNRFEEMREDVEAFVRAIPPAKIARIDVIKSGAPVMKPIIATMAGPKLDFQKLQLNKPRLVQPMKRKFEDALVPSQELTAEILSNMPLLSPATFSSSPRPHTPPPAVSTPLATIRVHTIQPSPVQEQLSPILPSPVQTTLGPIHPSPVQTALGPVHQQFGIIQPTPLLSQLLPLPQALIPQAVTQPVQFFKQGSPPVATNMPIKYDVITRGCSPSGYDDAAHRGNSATARPDGNNFDKASATKSNVHDMEIEPSGGNLYEDLRLFRESLEQERKTIWATN